MNGTLTCQTAREWLQAPEVLVVVEAHALSRHLDGCIECSDFQEVQGNLDSALRGYLDGAVGGATVRSQVMVRLWPERASRPRSRFLPRLSAHAFPLAAAVLVGVFLAIFLPQAASRLNQSTPQAIAWRAMHAEIAYPLAVDPRNPNHLIAGDRGQIYQSRDGGSSWRPLHPLPAGNIIRAVVIDAADPSHYLVATKHSVYVSPDAGVHWTQTAASLPGAMNMFLLQGSQQTFYLGPSILWSSGDRGQSWHPSGIGTVFAPDGIQALAVAPRGTLVAGIWAGGVAVSTDGGKTWQRRANGLPKNVIDVVATSAITFWAGTDRGIYFTTDGGSHWQYRGLRQVRVTSILVRLGYLLAGGTDGLYRSANGGKSWVSVTAGLPLDPYVYDFSLAGGRVFASLNTDGIFRSDDGGRTWAPASAGLPLSGSDARSRPVLFLRAGRLWMTSSAGSDPGLLTVDNTVRSAAVSPDGVSAAYVSTTGNGWEARVLSAGGGSLARLVAHGSGALPDRPLWSPTSAMLALVSGQTVVVSDLTGAQWTWALPPGQHVIGWGAGGHTLLLWDQATGRVTARTPRGALESGSAVTFTGMPVVAPDHRHLASVAGGRLQIGFLPAARRTVPLLGSCRPAAWSDDATLLLVTCGTAGDEIVSATGAIRTHLPALPHAFWAPSSHDLLFFRGGALWRWQAGTAVRLVPDAAPAGL